MDPTDIGLFRLAERRLAWVDRRQELLAQNIANADTPDYTARDLPPFERALQRTAPGTVPGVAPALSQTSPLHLAGTGAAASSATTSSTSPA